MVMSLRLTRDLRVLDPGRACKLRADLRQSLIMGPVLEKHEKKLGGQGREAKSIVKGTLVRPETEFILWPH